MLKKVIRKIIPKNIRLMIKEIIFIKKLEMKINKIHNKLEKCIIFIAVPTHGNLGDQAIVYAQYRIFEKLGLKDNIIEIKSHEYNMFNEKIEKVIKPNDTIVIDGGGNMGTLWMHEEYKMRDIITRFKNNKIIIFPETVFYSDDILGKNEFEKSKSIYGNHKNLHICVRDKRSYDLIKESYKLANIKYTPDIVLFVDNFKTYSERKDAIMCIRRDKERVTNTITIEKIEKILFKNNLKVSYSSTIIEGTVSKKNRERVLYKKWEEFSSAKIVITDRLHGMIFSAITGTPCIALNNCNGKVKGVYEWIKSLPYICFCENIENIEKDIEKLINIKTNKYSNKFLIESFNPILEMIKN